MNRRTIQFTMLATVALSALMVAQGLASDPGQSRVQIGFDRAPVPLDLNGKNRALVGLGSYLVNTIGDCNGCHTGLPTYLPGGDPFAGEPEQIDPNSYLVGGAPFFGPFVPRNLRPDPLSGLPAGYTFEEFLFLLRTGTDLKGLPPHVPGPGPENDLLQVMPWPNFSNLTEHDIRAIYEYLSALPPAP